MPSQPVFPVEILKYSKSTFSPGPDLIVTEEPLEIRVGYGPQQDRWQKSISVTMRTPGNDFDLAIGFLFTEGIIRSTKEVVSVNYCQNIEEPEAENNIVRVELADEMEIDFQKLERNFYMTSSCGICGKASIEAVSTLSSCPVLPQGPVFSAETILKVANQLQGSQPIFKRTGGLHASALFDVNGNIIAVMEDIGRHNAMDKLIGSRFFSDKFPLDQYGVFVSGRAGFELVQKSIMAGIPILAAVGAPSSLSVKLAVEFGQTLVGFIRGENFNVYSGKDRVVV